MGNGSIHPDEKDKAEKLLTGSYGSPGTADADEEQAEMPGVEDSQHPR